MGSCNSRNKKYTPQKPPEMDENDTLTFDISMANFKGRNFKKASLKERHYVVNSFWFIQRAPDSCSLQPCEPSGAFTSGKIASTLLTKPT